MVYPRQTGSDPFWRTYHLGVTDVLVTPAFLHEQGGAVRILDVRGRVLPQEPRYRAEPEAYRAGHIPGAVFVDWRRDFTDRDDPVPVQLAPPEAFAADATRLGIGNDSVVVAYDDYRNVLAGRVVWALRTYGHARSHILDGGLGAWVAAGHELREGDEQPAPADPPYRTGERGAQMWGLAEMRAALDRNVLILDARAHAEYAGVESHARRHGHIPGAVNVPYRDLLAGDGPFLPPGRCVRPSPTPASTSSGSTGPWSSTATAASRPRRSQTRSRWPAARPRPSTTARGTSGAIATTRRSRINTAAARECRILPLVPRPPAT